MVVVIGSPETDHKYNAQADVNALGKCSGFDPIESVAMTIRVYYMCPGYSIYNEAKVEGTVGSNGLEGSGFATVTENFAELYSSASWAYCSGEADKIEDGPFDCPRATGGGGGGGGGEGLFAQTPPPSSTAQLSSQDQTNTLLADDIHPATGANAG